MACAAGSCHIGLAEGGVPIMAGLWNNPFAMALVCRHLSRMPMIQG